MTYLSPMSRCVVSLHECLGFADRVEAETLIKSSGAEVVDHKINYRTSTVKFYLLLKATDGQNIATFKEKMKQTKIWSKISFD